MKIRTTAWAELDRRSTDLSQQGAFSIGEEVVVWCAIRDSAHADTAWKRLPALRASVTAKCDPETPRKPH
jgi:hypothetical protein